MIIFPPYIALSFPYILQLSMNCYVFAVWKEHSCAHLVSKHALFSFLLLLVLNCNLPFVCEQEWSPSHNLKSLKKKQMAAREAMARQTVSDAEQSSVESSVIRWAAHDAVLGNICSYHGLFPTEAVSVIKTLLCVQSSLINVTRFKTEYTISIWCKPRVCISQPDWCEVCEENKGRIHSNEKCIHQRIHSFIANRDPSSLVLVSKHGLLC